MPRRKFRRCRNGRSGRTRPTARPTSRSPSSTTSGWCRRATCRRTTPRCSICSPPSPTPTRARSRPTIRRSRASAICSSTRTSRTSRQAWDLFKAFGKVNIKLYTSAGAMIERVTSGEHTIAYGIFGSYALGRSKKVPNLGIVTPKDYTLVTSRVAFISTKAKNPNAATPVPRLSRVEARPEHHRQSGRPLFAARRRERRGDAQGREPADRRQGTSRFRSARISLPISTRRSGSTSSRSGRPR